MRSRNLTSDLFKRIFTFILTASVLFGALPVEAQTRRAAPKTVKASQKKAEANEQTTISAETVFPKPANSVMSQPWQSGELPAPLAMPAGNTDEAAAILAQKVAAKTDESVPALLAALQIAGFFVTDKNGQVALAPPDGKGQGLVVNAWEVAGMAKMLGDEKRVSLAELDKSLQSVPLLSELSKNNHNIGALLVEGIKANAANTRNPYLRVWARFIIELGKNSARKYDIGTAKGAAEIELDPVQHFLIMRRLYGDLWGRAELWKARIGIARFENRNEARFVNASYSPAASFGASRRESDKAFLNYNVSFASPVDEPQPDQKKIPCRMDGNAPTVMDAGATVSGVGWDKLLGYLEDAYQGTPTEAAVKKFSLYQAAANIILAYAKFIQSYAALETRIAVEDAEPLIRTRNVIPGARKRLKAEVRMNIGNWQMYNCLRLVMNATTGIDFATLNDGPIGDVGVQWALTEGGGGDYYSNSTGVNRAGEEIVVFAADAPRRIQDKGVGAGPGTKGLRTNNLTYSKTDGQGIAENILEGAPQKNEKNSMRVFEVRKQARVVTSIKLKAGEIKGDSVDVAGQAIAGIPGLITMPLEILYRTSWAASGAAIVPVIDWEECGGRGWSGTISITRRETESWRQDGEKKGVRTTTASAGTSRTYKYEGTINIKTAVGIGTNGYSATNKTVTSINVPLKGDASATSEIVREQESTSYYDDNCGQRNARKTLYNKLRIEETGEGQVIAEGNLAIDLVGNKYRFHITIPPLPGKETRTTLRRPSGYCLPEDNKPQDSASEASIEIEKMPIEIMDGVLDPKNPNVIEGSRSFTSSSGEEIEIRWLFRNCRNPD